MTLQEKLDAMREQSKTRMPAEVRELFARRTEDLRASGIMSRVAKVGSAAPDFTLPNATGQQVHLKDLVARGPVVLTFYRGRW